MESELYFFHLQSVVDYERNEQNERVRSMDAEDFVLYLPLVIKFEAGVRPINYGRQVGVEKSDLALGRAAPAGIDFGSCRRLRYKKRHRILIVGFNMSAGRQ